MPVFTEDKVRIGGLRRRAGKYSFKAAFNGKCYRVSLSAPGKFQVGNACVALAACARLGIAGREIEQGLARVSPKYRFQRISARPLLIADCAHNPEAAQALSAELAGMRNGGKVLLFSAMKDKDYGEVLRVLAPHFEKMVLCEVPLARSASLPGLFSAARRLGRGIVLVKNPREALLRAKGLAGRNGTVVAAGSIYLLAELFGRDKIGMAQ